MYLHNFYDILTELGLKKYDDEFKDNNINDNEWEDVFFKQKKILDEVFSDIEANLSSVLNCEVKVLEYNEYTVFINNSMEK